MDDRQEIEDIKKSLWNLTKKYENLASRVATLENQDVE